MVLKVKGSSKLRGCQSLKTQRDKQSAEDKCRKLAAIREQINVLCMTLNAGGLVKFQRAVRVSALNIYLLHTGSLQAAVKKKDNDG